jgi:hypothetical protein
LRLVIVSLVLAFGALIASDLLERRAVRLLGATNHRD